MTRWHDTDRQGVCTRKDPYETKRDRLPVDRICRQIFYTENLRLT